MIQDISPGCAAYLNTAGVRGYIGFDPTAPSLTLGNLVPVQILALFQKAGFQPIVVVGGATGLIGDPSGKDKERELKSKEELQANIDAQLIQFKKLLNFDSGTNKALLVNNMEFYEKMSIFDFLRTAGKTLTVNYMLSKESVKRRIETGISFTEFSYQILQAYDFECLFDQYQCALQMGGSDQWGNITSGIEFVRKNRNAEAHGITTPLLTKSDGSKFGKSEEGNIWLDPKLTSPYKFYQYFINLPDDDLPKITRYFTMRSQEEIEQEEKEYANDPRVRKQNFAAEITERIHGKNMLQSVEKVSNLLFGKATTSDELKSFHPEEFELIRQEIPHFEFPHSVASNSIPVLDLLCTHTQIVQSKGEARRSIEGQAVQINKEKIQSIDAMIDATHFLHQKYLLIENGKKNKFLITLK